MTVLLLTPGSVLGHGPPVEQCRQHSPDDGPQDVEPNAGEVARNEHGPQSANRVDGASGDGASYEDPDCKGEAHRYGGYGRRRPRVGRHRHHHEDEDEGDEDLQYERLEVADPLRRVGGRKVGLAPAGPAEGDPGAYGPEHGPH